MGAKNYDSFMSSLKKTKSQSLTLTRDVLNERTQLEEALDGIEQNIKLGINTMEKLKNEEQVLMEHQKDIDRNKDFEYDDIEQTIEDETTASGFYATNCAACNVTCHDACDIRQDSELGRCSVMDQLGNCTRCPGMCRWICHQSRLFKYVFKVSGTIAGDSRCQLGTIKFVHTKCRTMGLISKTYFYCIVSGALIPLFNT